jgi:glycyl-tRNA synthetase beta chain
MTPPAVARASTARADLLLEIGCEEIPAGMISKAAQDLHVILANQLASHALVDEPTPQASIETFGAPRRLVAIARNVRVNQQEVTREVMGPPRSVAYGGTGEPTRAAQSFAEKQGIPLSKLAIVSTAKGEYVAARVTIAGRPASQILGDILPEAIREISWPRSMVWSGAHGPRFIRPIRWIVATLGGKTLACTYADVRSGHHTEGHRFLGKREISVSGPQDYEARLKANFVLCRPEARREKIEAELRSLPARKGLRPHEDKALLEMVTYLNEYPTVILGDFDPEFLVLPEEILITVMRGHQKYFAVENRKGELAPHFLAVINLPRDSKGLVRQGHERVLRARFADAQFFWKNDQKIRLADYLPKLTAVTYERRLGSYADKVERMRWLARWLSEQWVAGGVTQADVAGADRAAELAKCDLVTDMVREFPELQGVVGGLYALAQGEPAEIAWAVYDQYKPLGLDDPLPRNLTGCAVALADKLDSLVACFAVGAIPTGSSDPFALRRAALGIVKIILEQKLPLSLSAAISAAARSLKQHALKIQASDAVERQALDFLLERARYILKERRGYAYDEISAAFAAGADDLGDAAERAAAVKAIRKTKDFGPLAASFKRIRNILEKSAGTGDKVQEAVDPRILKEVGELQLFTVAQQIGAEATRLKRERKYRKALEKISELRPAVDFFFDRVLVMAEDEKLRRNRIALLGGLLKEFSTIADFSELGAEEAK